MYLWGYHRIRGVWSKLQGPCDVDTLEQYRKYFAAETLSDTYASVPFSGFAGDTRATYKQFAISAKMPKLKNLTA